jgi:antitoxin VapB
MAKSSPSKNSDRPEAEPTPSMSLLALLATLHPLEEDFPPLDDPPCEPVDL